eukprot:2912346-Heterocapsa_arctica.AAC.1
MQRKVGGLPDVGHTIRHRAEQSDSQLCGVEGAPKLQEMDSTRKYRQAQQLVGNDDTDGEKDAGSNGSVEDVAKTGQG